MGDLIRTLNENGIQVFRDYLTNLRIGSTEKPPVQLLTDPRCSEKFSGNIEIERQGFATGLSAARYLYEIFSKIGYSSIDQDIGLWTWLSLYFIDQVCPINQSQKRIPGQDYRHILDTDYRRYYRHLLAGPYNVFRIHGETAPLLLCNPVFRPNRFFEDFSSRQGFLTNRGIIGAANIMYYDPGKANAKRGAYSSKRRPGTLLRFIDVVQQLDLTYDLYGMTGDQVLDLLPQEFDEWRNS